MMLSLAAREADIVGIQQANGDRRHLPQPIGVSVVTFLTTSSHPQPCATSPGAGANSV